MRPLRRAFLAAVLLASALAVPGPRAAGAATPDLTAFQGLGAWVDLYDPALLAAPERTVALIAGHGVRTLYLETSNYQMPSAVMNKASVGRFIDAAHARGLKVVAWYVPGFEDLRFDLDRVRAALRFRSGTGQRFDGFGLDIESTRVREYWERSRRAVQLSRMVRAEAGDTYPLAAIVLPPPLLDDSPTYWPGFPYRELAPSYDVFMPMGYWTYRYDGLRGAYDFTVRTIEGLRARTGRPALAIHPIGGIADAMSAEEGRGFMRAVREYGAIGASLYDVGTSDAVDWAGVSGTLPVPVQDPPSPLTLNKRFDAYGNLPAGDTSHPRDVAFRVGRRTGVWELDFEAFGLDATRVAVQVNWRRVATLEARAPGWGPRRTLRLPAGLLDHERNSIVFTSLAPGPQRPAWGIRAVSLVPGPLSFSDRAIHGNIPGRETTRADRVTYAVPEGEGLLSVTVQAFDVSPGEVEIRLNDTSLGPLLPTEAGRWGLVQTILVPASLLGPGSHRLSFDAVGFPPERSVWGVRLLDARKLTLVPGH